MHCVVVLVTQTNKKAVVLDATHRWMINYLSLWKGFSIQSSHLVEQIFKKNCDASNKTMNHDWLIQNFASLCWNAIFFLFVSILSCLSTHESSRPFSNMLKKWHHAAMPVAWWSCSMQSHVDTNTIMNNDYVDFNTAIFPMLIWLTVNHRAINQLMC